MSELTFWHIGGFKIQEPITLLTDLLITVLCLWLAWNFRKKRRQIRINQYFWRYLLLLGIGAGLGGILGHGINYMLTPGWKLIFYIFLGISVFFLQKMSLESLLHLIRPACKNFLESVLIFQLLSFLFLIFNNTVHFDWVMMQSVFGLFGIVLPMHLYGYYHDRHFARKWVVAGIVWSVIPVIVYVTKFNLHLWFNYSDLGHIVLLPTVYLIYRGAISFSRVPPHTLASPPLPTQ